MTGIPGGIRLKALEQRDLVEAQQNQPMPVLPQGKVFKSKHGQQRLKDYSKPAPKGFWETWPSVTWDEAKNMRTNIDVSKLREMASVTKYPYQHVLNQVCENLEHGAKLGVADECQIPSTSNNAVSAFEHGEEVTDALFDWLVSGYVMGPMDKAEIPFDKVKKSGLMCKIKPNGKARIIVNLSKGKPVSVNEGINKKDFKTSMSSTTEWIRVLLRCGKNCRFFKLDWASAYKQIRVHRNDIHMQCFEWLGKFFFELCLIFGSVSSPGIYDMVAKVVLHISRVKADFPAYLIIQHLDDVCGCSPAGSDKVDKLYETYIEVCEQLGVELADPSDPDKAFSPRTSGQVLGVEYDSTNMTWHLREDKMSIILNMLDTAIKDGQATARFMKKLCGKLIDIRNLVEGSKFHLANILIATNKFTEAKDMENIVTLDDWCKSDMVWFKIMLPVYSNRTEL